MKGLMQFDFQSNKKTILLATLCIGAFVVYALVKGGSQALTTLPAAVYLSQVLMLTSYIKDAKEGLQKYLFSMPIGKRDYILSKLTYPLIFGLVASALISLECLLGGKMDLATIPFIFLGILLINLFLGSLQLIFLVKFGEERGRFVLAGVIIVFVVLVNLFRENTDFLQKIYLQMEGSSWILIASLCILLGGLMVYGLVRGAIGLLEKKEY